MHLNQGADLLKDWRPKVIFQTYELSHYHSLIQTLWMMHKATFNFVVCLFVCFFCILYLMDDLLQDPKSTVSICLCFCPVVAFYN